MSSHLQAQLDRLEGKLDHIVQRVDKLERRASFWGAVGGALTAVLTHVAACF